MGKKATEWEIIEALAKRYCPPEWAFLPHVADGTGTVKCRTADALAMSLWPSRGLSLYGFEIKVSRTDWLKELKAPEKAESIAQYCDYWYLVVNDPDIVKAGELPSTWGMIKAKKRIEVIKEPVKMTPEPPDLYFIAAILRKAAEYLTPRAALKEAYMNGIEYRKTTEECHNKTLSSLLEELRKKVREFEEKSGVQIDNWRYGNVGAAVKLVVGGENISRMHRDELARLAGKSRKITEAIEKILEEPCASKRE